MTVKHWKIKTTWRHKRMTAEQLKKIVSTLPDDTQVYIEMPDAWQDLNTVLVEYSEEGTRLVLSIKEG